MFCPKCGQERISMDTSFCSRCGFLLTGTADILQLGGLLPRLSSEPSYQPPSPRSRGIKQGAFILLLSILIIPLLTVFSILINLRTPALVIVAAILLLSGGMLRMAYAWMFESPVRGGFSFEENTLSASPSFHKRTANAELPPQQTYPASSYAAPGKGPDTRDLEPRSVTEHTTRHLKNTTADQ